MQTLSRALKHWQGKARQIDIPFRGVQELVDFRTGDIAVLAGAPGGGKSLTALNWAHRSSDPMLYLAQDSPRSVFKRLTALALGRRVSDIREEDADYWAKMLAERGRREELVLATGSHTVEMIGDEIDALTEWLMEPPTVVFIDNLFDLKSEGGNYMETGFYAVVLPTLKQLAIDKDVGIVVLHHVTRGSDNGKSHPGDGVTPLRMNNLLFAGEREARHVWGVYRGYGNRSVNFQVLKQQDGRADPNGGVEVRIDWDAEEGRLLDR